MTLTELMQAMHAEPGLVRSTVTDDWLQGRSAFGGLQGAFALWAMRTLVPASTPLRAFQMTFIAPVSAGDVATRARVLRAGKNTMHVEARIEDGDDVLAHAIAIFGSSRESMVRHELPHPTPSPTVGGTRLPFVPNVVPNFMQHFDVRLLDGALPFSGSAATRNVFDLGMDESGNATETHLLAIADFVPPVALSWVPKPTPGSSMTWMLEVLDQNFAAQPLKRWRVDSEMIAARDGYTSQSTVIYAPNGVATVLSRQSMALFG
jgi:hypothetical protein